MHVGHVRRGCPAPPRGHPGGTWARVAVLFLALFLGALGPISFLGMSPGGSASRSGPSVAVVPAGSGPATGPFVANFTMSAAEGDAPLNVTFLASATGGTSPYQFTWDFGDGTTGNGPRVVHDFVNPGAYVVVLRASDAAGAKATVSADVTVLAGAGVPPSTGIVIALSLIAVGAGIGLGIWASRRIARRAQAPSAPTVGVVGTRPGYGRTPLLEPGGPPPPVVPAPYGPVPPTWVVPVGAPVRPPTFLPRPPPPPSPAEDLPARTPPARNDARGAGPAQGSPSISGPSLRPGSGVPKGAAAPPQPSLAGGQHSPEVPASVGELLSVDLTEGTSLLDAARHLNELNWSSLEEDVGRAPSPLLSRVVAHLDPLVQLLRGHLQDPERVRRLLRDVTQDWYQKGQHAGSNPASESRSSYRSLFAPSVDGDTPSLLERMGRSYAGLTWRAFLRMGPWLAALLASFVALEASTFVLLYVNFHGGHPSAVESLVVPVAVLGPPTLVLCLFPVAEWGHLLWNRFRSSPRRDRLYLLPSVRMSSYLLVLALAEISRAVADLVSGSIFGTPSSFAAGGSSGLLDAAAFLLLLSATIFLGWAAAAGWNLGGSRRATFAASLLYLLVLAVWLGTEAKLLVDIAQGATWAGVADAQHLLAYVPADLLVVSFFVLMVFFAFSEPEWLRAHAAATQLRAAVAQAFVDDLGTRAPGSRSVPLEHLSDLARGQGAPKVARAMRELFDFDTDGNRYVALRWHDDASDTILTVHIRQDEGGAVYVLDAESRAASSDAAAGLAGGTVGLGTSTSAMTADIWSGSQLTNEDAWLAALRARKGQGRLSRPPSEARDGPVYRTLILLLAGPASTEARELFRKVGWTKPSGPMLMVELLQAAERGEALTPEIETDGDYLEVELNRATQHAEDKAPFLGPWDLLGWHIVREVSMPVGGTPAAISYRATRQVSPGAGSKGSTVAAAPDAR